MGLVKEFKEFIIRGNVVDLAVAVIIAGAFGKIVTSFVADILMPPIGLALGGVDFKDLKYVLQDAVGETPAVAINYGIFIQHIIDFLIIGLAIFAVIKAINRFNRKQVEEEAVPEPTKEEALLTEIRDILKRN